MSPGQRFVGCRWPSTVCSSSHTDVMREKRSQNVHDDEGPEEYTNKWRAVRRGMSHHSPIIPLIPPNSKPCRCYLPPSREWWATFGTPGISKQPATRARVAGAAV